MLVCMFAKCDFYVGFDFISTSREKDDRKEDMSLIKFYYLEELWPNGRRNRGGIILITA